MGKPFKGFFLEAEAEQQQERDENLLSEKTIVTNILPASKATDYNKSLAYIKTLSCWIIDVDAYNLKQQISRSTPAYEKFCRAPKYQTAA